MKRALWFLIAALIMALIVQPNLSTVHEPEVRTPTNTTTNAKTNDTIDMGISRSKATICLDAGVVVSIPAIQAVITHRKRISIYKLYKK